MAASTGIVGTGLPPTATLKKSHKIQSGDLGGDVEATILKTQDNLVTRPPIFVYNICEMAHIREQPPEFPSLEIEACPKGERFSVKMLPGLVNERYMKPG